jgi:hypothetical protein
MLHRWLFTLESRPPLNTQTNFSQLGVSDDTHPLTFTQHGDLYPIGIEDIKLYNLPPDANGSIGQFSHYQTQP